jgi:hypothetical protein
MKNERFVLYDRGEDAVPPALLRSNSSSISQPTRSLSSQLFVGVGIEAPPQERLPPERNRYVDSAT